MNKTRDGIGTSQLARVSGSHSRASSKSLKRRAYIFLRMTPQRKKTKVGVPNKNLPITTAIGMSRSSFWTLRETQFPTKEQLESRSSFWTVRRTPLAGINLFLHEPDFCHLVASAVAASAWFAVPGECEFAVGGDRFGDVELHRCEWDRATDEAVNPGVVGF